jgi:hypothetical protein
MLGLNRDLVSKSLISRTFHIRNNEDVNLNLKLFYFITIIF